MEDEAFDLLAQIDHGEPPAPALRARWAAAFKTVSWVVETDHGLKLTPAGQGALAAFNANRRKAAGS